VTLSKVGVEGGAAQIDAHTSSSTQNRPSQQSHAATPPSRDRRRQFSRVRRRLPAHVHSAFLAWHVLEGRWGTHTAHASGGHRSSGDSLMPLHRHVWQGGAGQRCTGVQRPGHSHWRRRGRAGRWRAGRRRAGRWGRAAPRAPHSVRGRAGLLCPLLCRWVRGSIQRLHRGRPREVGWWLSAHLGHAGMETGESRAKPTDWPTAFSAQA
jgi:hypothetical protein